MEHLDPSNHSGNKRVSLLSLYILSFWSLTLLLLPLLSPYLLSCSKNKLNKNRAKLLDLNLKIPRKECAIFNTPNFCVQLPKHQQTNQQTNQPTNQPTKYRAFQISFVGLGGQGKCCVWQYQCHCHQHNNGITVTTDTRVTMLRFSPHCISTLPSVFIPSRS